MHHQAALSPCSARVSALTLVPGGISSPRAHLVSLEFEMTSFLSPRHVWRPRSIGSRAYLLVQARDQWAPGAPGRISHSHSSNGQRYLSSRVKLGTSPPATFSRGQPPSLRFFPPAVFPPRGGTPSRSFTTAGSSHTRPTLPLKARSFVLPPVLSCTMALWPPTTGFQRSSVQGMLGLPFLYLSPPLVVLYCRGGETPGALSSLTMLPRTVEVYRSVSYLPLSYVGRMDSLTHIASPETSLSSSSSDHSPLLRSTPALGSLPCSTQSTQASTACLSHCFTPVIMLPGPRNSTVML